MQGKTKVGADLLCFQRISKAFKRLIMNVTFLQDNLELTLSHEFLTPAFTIYMQLSVVLFELFRIASISC